MGVSALGTLAGVVTGAALIPFFGLPAGLAGMIALGRFGNEIGNSININQRIINFAEKHLERLIADGGPQVAKIAKAWERQMAQTVACGSLAIFGSYVGGQAKRAECLVPVPPAICSAENVLSTGIYYVCTLGLGYLTYKTFKEKPLQNREVQENKNDMPAKYLPYSVHRLAGVSEIGDSIQLEDGSGWQVSHPKVLKWKSTDNLLVEFNSMGCVHRYQIRNVTQNQTVKATLKTGPIENGENTVYISSLDQHSLTVQLDNGTSWKISRSDLAYFREFVAKDCVIIGTNNSYSFCSADEAILINVNMNTYARAKSI